MTVMLLNVKSGRTYCTKHGDNSWLSTRLATHTAVLNVSKRNIRLHPYIIPEFRLTMEEGDAKKLGDRGG